MLTAHPTIDCIYQVQMLLNEKRVSEALQLAHVAMETVTGPQRDEKVHSYKKILNNNMCNS